MQSERSYTLYSGFKVSHNALREVAYNNRRALRLVCFHPEDELTVRDIELSTIV